MCASQPDPRQLHSLQKRLAAEILGRTEATSADDGLRSELRLPSGIDPNSRLAVYRDGYPARILEALRDVYPAVANICGDGSFTNLVRRYLRSRDLSTTALNDVGRELPAYLREDPLAEQLPLLADLAQLEWQVLLSFHSHDRPPVEPALLSALDMDDWERAVLRFQPSVAIVQSAWPIRDLWTSRETPRDRIDIALTDRPQAVLVHRVGYDVDCALLDGARRAVLEALLRGEPLGRAMQALAEVATDAIPDPSAMFADWLAANLITSLELAPAE